MDAENRESYSQRDSVERKEYVRAHRSFNRIWKERSTTKFRNINTKEHSR